MNFFNFIFQSSSNYINSIITKELNYVFKFFNKVYYLKKEKEENSNLLENLEAFPVDKFEKNDDGYNALLLNGNLNYDKDIQGTLQSLWKSLNRTDRIFLIIYNPYYRFLYNLASRYGFISSGPPSTFVSKTDLINISRISGFEVVRVRAIGFIPFKLFGLGDILNNIFLSLPIMKSLGITWIVFLRPIKKEVKKPSLSILVPARNEKGNLENLVNRLDYLKINNEIIFVEGHSTDGTWEEIQRITKKYKDSKNISCYKQEGKGKADAVRLGFKKAKNNLYVILDADLSVEPELLIRFYDAWCKGHGDFINGNRLVYPYEGQAMKFLNWLGNIFFAKSLSYVLDVKIGDSLCGTKLFSAEDYQRFVKWREDFGDKDPFGDFDLLFPASILGLGIIDIPIHYKDRVYGSTNISRFTHGAMLFKMTLLGLKHIKLYK